MGMKPRPSIRPEMKLGEVSFERKYDLVGIDGQSKHVVYLRFGKPKPWVHGYSCVFSIKGLRDREVLRWECGEDPLGALYSAMAFALVELVCSPPYMEKRLYWQGKQGHLGLPPVKEIEDCIHLDR